jgi:predicted ATPase/class 3 adenylate cyclase
MEQAAPLPTGTVTFLFTDIEGSTRLWEQHPDAMRQALARHHALITATVEQCGGIIVKSQGEGDSFFAVFARATDAVAAASALQRALLAEPWPAAAPLRVRVALHTGEADLRENDYYGAAVSRCARLRAIGHGGQVLLSLPTEQIVRDALPAGVALRDLGSHRLKDLQRPEQVFQLLHPDLPADFPSLASLDALPNNLPLQVTSFIGREREMAEVKRLLEGTRLLTVTGAGGTGKTRLALQVAAELLTEYPDGVWLVELAPLADPTLVPQTVAAVLGVKEQPGTPITQTLVAALKPKTLLVLLDNCEHLLAACAPLAEVLLRSCPGVRLLATSREGLGIGSEQKCRIPPLSSPAPQDLPPTVESLTGYEAVHLFLDRARLSQAGFTITNENAAALAQVCHRLDGIPLAIELAAARVRALPVEKLNERLDDRFRLLTGGSRTALPHQQTLRALIDWSYDLLTEAERALLRRLSVFAGGWTLEAAEAVCAGEGIEEWDVLDLLTSLVEKSLVQYEEQGEEGRYRLLEMVRQYGREQLMEAGEGDVVRGRHVAFYLRLAQEAEPQLRIVNQSVWLDRLVTEHDNLRAALEWCLNDVSHPGVVNSAEAAWALCGALYRFWDVRSNLREGLEWLERAISVSGDTASAARGKALTGACHLAWRRGENALARSRGEEALTIHRQLGNKEGIAISLNALGNVATSERQLSLARRCFEESLALSRASEDLWGIGQSLNNLGSIALMENDYAQARSLCEEALTIAERMGDLANVHIRLRNLSHLDCEEGRFDSARSRGEQALRMARRLGDKRAIAVSLLRFGGLAAAQGQSERAATLLAAAEALCETIGYDWQPDQRNQHDRCVAATHAALGEAAFAAAWAEGQALTLEEAVALALAL